jgi:hypothetical protein
MYKFLRTVFLISILFVLAGCAGRDFIRPSSDAFKLGKTTYSEIVQQMGEPSKVGNVLKNGKQMKSISYLYANTGGEPLEEGVIPARALMYFFHNDGLVGQGFIASFKSDNSNFDDTKIDRIIKGKTTRAEVIQLLGRPSASYIPPMVKETSGEAIGYAYQTTRGSAFSEYKFFSKVLKISFDDRNIVSDIDYASLYNK